MLGKIVVDDMDLAWEDPNERNLVAEASVERPRFYPGSGQKKVILVDFGCKDSILRHLVNKRLDVLRVPWNYDWSEEIVDGVVLSNGPGDPKMCVDALKVLRKGLRRDIPILGICLGHQLLALGCRRRYVQVEVWPSQPEPTLHSSRNQALLHYIAEPWFRCKRENIA